MHLLSSACVGCEQPLTPAPDWICSSWHHQLAALPHNHPARSQLVSTYMVHACGIRTFCSLYPGPCAKHLLAALPPRMT